MVAVPHLVEAWEVAIALQQRIGGVRRLRDRQDGARQDLGLGLARASGGVDWVGLDALQVRKGTGAVAVLHIVGAHAIVLDHVGDVARHPERVERLRARGCHSVGSGVERSAGCGERCRRAVLIGCPCISRRLIGGPARQHVAVLGNVCALWHVDHLIGGVLVGCARGERIGTGYPHATLRIEDDLARSLRVEETQHEHVVRVAHDGAGCGGGEGAATEQLQRAADDRAIDRGLIGIGHIGAVVDPGARRCSHIALDVLPHPGERRVRRIRFDRCACNGGIQRTGRGVGAGAIRVSRMACRALQGNGSSHVFGELDRLAGNRIPVPVLNGVGGVADPCLVVEDQRHAAICRNLAGELHLSIDGGEVGVGDGLVACAIGDEEQVGTFGKAAIAGVQDQLHRGARRCIEQRILVSVHVGALGAGAATIHGERSRLLEVLIADDLATLNTIDADIERARQTLVDRPEVHDAAIVVVAIAIGAHRRNLPERTRYQELAVVARSLCVGCHLSRGRPAYQLVAIAGHVAHHRQVDLLHGGNATIRTAGPAVVVVLVVVGPVAIAQVEDDVLLACVVVEDELGGAIALDTVNAHERGQVDCEREAGDVVTHDVVGDVVEHYVGNSRRIGDAHRIEYVGGNGTRHLARGGLDTDEVVIKVSLGNHGAALAGEDVAIGITIETVAVLIHLEGGGAIGQNDVALNGVEDAIRDGLVEEVDGLVVFRIEHDGVHGTIGADGLVFATYLSIVRNHHVGRELIAERRGDGEVPALRVVVQQLDMRAGIVGPRTERVSRIVKVDRVAEHARQIAIAILTVEANLQALVGAIAMVHPNFHDVLGLDGTPYRMERVDIVGAFEREQRIVVCQIRHHEDGAMARTTRTPEAIGEQRDAVCLLDGGGAFGVGALSRDVPAPELIAFAVNVCVGRQRGLATGRHRATRRGRSRIDPRAVAQVEHEHTIARYVVELEHRGAVAGYVELGRVGEHIHEHAALKDLGRTRILVARVTVRGRIIACRIAVHVGARGDVVHRDRVTRNERGDVLAVNQVALDGVGRLVRVALEEDLQHEAAIACHPTGQHFIGVGVVAITAWDEDWEFAVSNCIGGAIDRFKGDPRIGGPTEVVVGAAIRRGVEHDHLVGLGTVRVARVVDPALDGEHGVLVRCVVHA